LRVLVTRPQPRAADTALALRERGHDPIIAPLTEMELLAEVDPESGPWTAIVLTSANGLWGICKSAGHKNWYGIPVFAVGDSSAKAARHMGFAEVASARGNVNDLVDLVTTRLKPPARLLYLAGEERAGDLAGDLRAQNFEVDLVVVYRFLTAQSLPSPAAEALAGDIDAILHYSRASAETFLNAARNSNLLETALTKPLHLCLSDQIAASLRQAGARQIRVAARPEEAALLELCG
jgi:uroporphyrinogen-III synthase